MTSRLKNKKLLEVKVEIYFLQSKINLAVKKERAQH